MVYIRANGVVLNIEVRGRGEPVVLIPDLGENLTTWCFQAGTFGGLHFIMQVDNRGSGWSDCPEDCSIENMASDIISLMDLIGVDRAHLVGQGLGGMIAQEVAVRRPGRVNGMVLVSTSARVTEEQRLVLGALIDAAGRGGDLRTLSAAMLPWLYSPWFIENDHWREYVMRARAASYRRTSWEGAERQLRSMRQYDSSERLGSIRSPVLVIGGSDDLLTPPPCSEELAAGIVNAQCCQMDAGHMLQVERPRTFNQTVLSFLAGVEGGAAPDLGTGMPIPFGGLGV